MKEIIMGFVAILALALILYRNLRNKPSLEFQKYYYEILNSDKYKVKGRHEN